MRVSRRPLLLLLLALCCAVAPAGGVAARPVTVLAAASLTDALTEIGARYAAATGETVRFAFSSSSTAARQIEAGAPADIFASANLRWMDYLAEKGAIAAGTRIDLLVNRLVLVAPATAGGDPVEPVDGSAIVARLGADGRLAVGDPDHVPAGLYAKQALTALGAWPVLAPRLARADDVRAALALVARGEAPLGIVYATDAAIVAGVRIVGEFPAAAHQPIVYPFALTADAADNPAARRFLAWLAGPEARAAFGRYGFAANPAQ